MQISGELAVVTGAGSGIGRATALALAARGARVAISDVDAGGLAETASALGADCAHEAILDVADRAAFAAYAATIQDACGVPGIVVNNAGVGLAGELIAMDPADWDWLMGVNLNGVMHGCRFFGPLLVEAGHGHIVNIASMLGLMPLAGTAAYCASKFAVVGLSESLRGELAPYGVGVSAVCPGLINTRIAATGRRGDIDAAEYAEAVRQFATRGADPATVAEAVCAAVERDVAVRPVRPEAWAAWYARRLAPTLTANTARLVRRVLRR